MDYKIPKKHVQNICAQIASGRSTAKQGGKGRLNNRTNKTDERLNSAHEHIKAFSKYVNYYSRYKNTNKVFLDHGINLQLYLPKTYQFQVTVIKKVALEVSLERNKRGIQRDEF